MICELVGGMYDLLSIALAFGRTKFESSHDWSNDWSSPASRKSRGLIEARMSGNWPEAWSCLAYPFRSAPGVTILSIETLGRSLRATLIELSQNAASRAGVSNVRNESLAASAAGLDVAGALDVAGLAPPPPCD